jgi:hypothetical protein
VTRPNQALVTLVDGLHADVQASFWQHVNTIFVHPDARPVVARKLIERHRPWGAIDLLVTMLHAVGGGVAPDVDLVESMAVISEGDTGAPASAASSCPTASPSSAPSRIVVHSVSGGIAPSMSPSRSSLAVSVVRYAPTINSRRCPQVLAT